MLGQILFARLLGPDSFGLFTLGWTILSMSLAVAPFGMDKAVIRFGSSIKTEAANEQRNVILYFLIAASLFGLLGSLGLLALIPGLAYRVYREPDLIFVLRWFAVALFFSTVLRVSSAATRVSNRMQFSAIGEDLLPPLVHLLSFLVLFLSGMRISAAVYSAPVGFAVGLTTVLLFIGRLFNYKEYKLHLPLGRTKEFFQFSLAAVLTGVLSIFGVWSIRLIVGYYLSLSDVGIYQAASQASLLPAIIISAMNVSVMPMIAKLSSEKKRVNLENLYRVVTKWSWYLTLPIFIIFTFSSNEMLEVLFGFDYSQGGTILRLLLLGQFALASTGPVGGILMMSGYQSDWLWIGGISLASSLGSGFLLIPRIGLLGGAAATVLGQLIANALGLIFVRYRVHVWPFDRRFIKILITSLATSGFLWFVVKLQFNNSLLKVIVITGIGLVLFLGGLLGFGLDAEDDDLLKSFAGRFRLRFISKV